MQKKLIALAVAGLASTGAFAQSNVTIYGLLQPSYDFMQVDGRNDISDMVSNNSRLGFKGEEAIGNGLKAIFQIESQIDLTDRGDNGGDASLARRDSWVGLSSSAGSITFGNHQSAYVRSSASYDWFADTIGDYNNIMGLYSTSSADGTYDFNRRLKKSAYYTSPSFSGFQVLASYAMKEQFNGSTSPDVFSLAGTYTNGGLGLLAGYEEQSHDGPNGKDSAWKIGASYKFGFGTKLAAIYESGEDSELNNVDIEHWFLTASHPITANIDIAATYMDASETNGGNNDGASAWALGIDYKFSKRTSLQGVYAAIDNDSNGLYFVDSGAYAGDAGADIDGFSIRLKHSF